MRDVGERIFAVERGTDLKYPCCDWKTKVRLNADWLDVRLKYIHYPLETDIHSVILYIPWIVNYKTLN